MWFRHADPRFPFLWQSAPQPSGRWHAAEDAPASYFADTPDGAWAEFLRHEEISDPADLDGVARRLWAAEIPHEVVASAVEPDLDFEVLVGGTRAHPACQAEARRLRETGARALLAPSAALLPGGARGQVVDAGLREAESRDGEVLVLFGGAWPEVRGWVAAAAGAPTRRLLDLVRYLSLSGG